MDPKDIVEYVEDLRGLLEEGQVCDRKTFIKGFVREIRVKGDEVTLEYTPPLPDGRRETVLSSGCYGGQHRIRTCDFLRVMQLSASAERRSMLFMTVSFNKYTSLYI